MALKRSRDTKVMRILRNTCTWLISTSTTIMDMAQPRSLTRSRLNGHTAMPAGSVARK